MLDQPYSSHYIAFVIALPVAIFIQNAFLSVFHLTKHHSYVSTILKTLFNLSGAARLLVSFAVIMVSIITAKQCDNMTFVHEVLSFIYRESLVAFLLWRLIHITNSVWDKHVALILILTRTGLQLYQIIADRLVTHSTTTDSCNVLVHDKLATIMFVVTDYLIDLYITVRLAQILGSANRKYSRSVSVPRDSKRTIFTAVLWWNLLRVFVATLVDSLALYTVTATNIDQVLFNTLQAIVCIAMSYVLTFDADIVRKIQGKTTVYNGDHETGSRVGHTSVSEVTVTNETQPEILQSRIKDDDLERNGNRTNVGSGAWLPPNMGS
ncbi:7913_t:CDS:2 [Paraglomus brasilianum]|uniref:7913_t:CDS:1 n=1 Tax=Paraglomus brasilianum TaxID=144538 RepID=A0A9N8VPM9_9GLOM|nr:7913_t:CDS:2 [Paraglomus brasilianum]